MPRYSRRRRSVKVSPLLRKKIKKVIEGVAEKKWMVPVGHNGPYYAAISKSWGGVNPNATNSLQELTEIIGSVVQGDTSQDRTGRDIKLHMFRLKGHLFLQEDGYPVVTTMYILSMKNLPQATLGDTAFDPASAFGGPSLSMFLGGINGPAVTGPNGLLSDLDSTINAEQFTVHYKKVFKLGGQNTQDSIYAPGHGYSLSRSFDINLKKIVGSHIRWLNNQSATSYLELNIPKLFLVLLHNSENQKPVYTNDNLNAPTEFNVGPSFAPPEINYHVFGNFTDI